MTRRALWGAMVALGVLLAGCAGPQLSVRDLADLRPPTTKSTKRGLNSYVVRGVRYRPHDDRGYKVRGTASWYGPNFHGKQTANGDIYNQYALTAAHKTLPLGSYVNVTNLRNGRTLTLLINDRGPFARGRIIDVSKRAAMLLDFEQAGIAPVIVQRSDRDGRPLRGSRPDVARQVQAQAPAPVQRPVSVQAPVQAVPALPGVDPVRAPAPQVAEAWANHPLVVQAGSFADFDNARRLQSRLADVGPASITQINSLQPVMYRVVLGPYTDALLASQVLKQVQARGLNQATLRRFKPAALQGR